MVTHSNHLPKDGEDNLNFILATTNKAKVAEIKGVFGEDHTVRALADIGFSEEIMEDGNTFEENAIIKVKAIQKYLNHANEKYDYILADDSGLSIDALNGEPGVQSAFWMGLDTPYDIRNIKALKLLKDVPEERRGACFTTVIACAFADGAIHTTEGILKGRIAFEPAGVCGFGYDPIFFIPNLNRTLAQLSKEEKNQVSHRAIALRRMCNLLGVDLK